jgi:hypothetical protein
MSFPTDRRVSIPDTVLFQEVSGESVLLDLASEQYFGLDEVGTRVWQLLGESRRLDEVYERLLREYEVEPDALTCDLWELLEALAEAGLIVMLPATQSDEEVASSD